MKTIILPNNHKIMLCWPIFRWLFLYFSFLQRKASTWPSSESSNIQILGIFDEISNDTECSIHARAMFKAAILLSQQYKITIDGQLIGWRSVETNRDIVDTLSAVCQAISTSNIIGIIGPTILEEAYLITDFGKKLGLPIISYSVSDHKLSDRNVYPNFYRIIPSDKSAALVLVELFIRFNWTSCILIYQNDDFGSGGAKAINEAFIDSNLTIHNIILFDPMINRIQGDLKTSLMKSSTRIVVLWVQREYIPLILQDALESGVLGPKFTWILSSSIPLNGFDKKFHENLIGLLSIEPVAGNSSHMPANRTLLTQAYQIWKKFEPQSFPVHENVNYYALFAFDATWLLIKSLEKLCSTDRNNSVSSCLLFNQSSFCFHRFFIHSDLLFNAITTTEFLGASGPIKFNFNATDQISYTHYHIKNVQSSLDSLNFVSVFEYSSTENSTMLTKEDDVVWPGRSLEHPTGRASLEGLPLRIGIIGPIPFVKKIFELDENGQNITKLTGYIPDLIALLETNIKFIPDIRLMSTVNQTYDGLIESVANDEYDIIIADATVTAKRRQSVSFSNSIFDNSFRVIMRKSSDINIDLLSFVRPFSPNLWLLLLVTCLYAGLLICLLERKDNEKLQNRRIASQLAMSIWYSFGNIVGYGVDFHVNTAAGRLLTGGLYMFSLILVVTYTAHLTSELTLLKSKHIISGIEDIKKGKIKFDRIGIRPGSASEEYYLREISAGDRNYHKLISQNDLYERLRDRTIDASFMDSGTAEYITNNVHCDLTLIGEDFDKSIFGIVFPKQWLYAKDFDVIILSLREKGKLGDLREKWFRKTICPNVPVTKNVMDIDSLGGLFLILGVISFLSLLLFLWGKRIIFKNYLSSRIAQK